jgi:small subunit ribosomal protein S2
MEEDGTMASHSKKMISTLRRERRKIERNLGGIREMSTLPGALVVVDPGREVNAVKEARRLGVPVVGVLDSDCDPTLVDIIIPGNDDALKSVRLLVERLALSVEEGCANRREQAAVSAGKGEDQAPSDEPRPTRTLRPLPKGLKPSGAASPAPTEGEGTGEQAESPAPAPAPEEGQQPAAGAETTEEVAAETPAGESKTE